MASSCSILIVNWNSWEPLSCCLKALSKQTFQDFKIYVADNASDQPPPEGIFSIVPNMVFVQNDFNYGFAKANNRLLEHAKGSEWVVLLNPDAFPEPNWLEQLMNAVLKHPDYQFFASRLVMEKNPSDLDGDGDCYHLSGLAWRKGHGSTVCKKTIPSEVFSPCAAASMYKAEIILKAGGFDEEFFCYFEDVDLGFRLRLVGEKCLLVPSAVVHHIGSVTSGGQQSDFSVYHGHRNLVWTYLKNMPGLLFWLLMPLHLILNLFSLILFTARGQGCVILKSKWDAIKGIPIMWQKRKDIQSCRVASIKGIWSIMDKQLIPRKKRN